MPRTTIALLPAAILGLCAGAAHASCSIGEFHAIASGVTYDPFDVEAPTAPISVTASTSGSCRSARVQLALVSTAESPRTGPTVSLAANGGLLNASVLDAGGGARNVAAAVNTAFIDQPPYLVVGTQGIQTSGAALRLQITPGQPAPPALYTAHLLLVARVTDDKGVTTDTQTPLDLSVNVKPSVRLAAGGTDLLIDLGELKSGGLGQVPVSFVAYANLGYELNLKSANGFTLARAGGGTGGPSYTPLLTPGPQSQHPGDTIDVLRFSYDAPRGDGRRNHTLNIQLAPLGRQPAGNYSDDLTLEIRAEL